MKIGLLTYHSAFNFGANLQTYSTYNYLKNKGYDPVIIDYVPTDMMGGVYSSFPVNQKEKHHSFIYGLHISDKCFDSKTVAEALRKENIKNIIVGSDAVLQHHPYLSRIVFPSRHIVSFSKVTSDRMFPGPFWGGFLDYCPEVNAVLMSVSSQQAKYHLFPSSSKFNMAMSLSRFKYISVRDDWTADMVENITKGLIRPEVTPDPVFAFNYNCHDIPSKDEILNRFNLPENYILLSLRRGKSVTPQWVLSFEKECLANGYHCIGLPFPYGFTSIHVANEKIQLPLSPMDWYAIIKYSSGYVGHNMHTIVSALHNSVPCYSFDQYGQRLLGQFVNDRSSKIFDILSRAGFSENRAVSGTVFNRVPTPEYVFSKISTFDKEKCRSFSDYYLKKYLDMMNNIESIFA